MKFIKDILLFQIETTGPNPDRDNILQLSAVLLDKDNLLEKNFFNSYIKVSFLDNTVAQHAEFLQIPFETLQKSPKLPEVMKKFDQIFGSEPLLATHGVSNVQFLRHAYKKTTLSFNFHHHVLDVWTLGYIYTLHYGIKKMPTLDTLSQHFNIKSAGLHNALEKVRASAAIFRRIING